MRTTSTATPGTQLADLFDIFNLPTRQRFAIIVNELGIGLSGNGENAGAVIVRASPALQAARRVLGILREQRQALAGALAGSDRIISQLASRPVDVRRFLAAAAGTSTLTAAHAPALALTVKRLPALLAAARPALQRLDLVAQAGTPLAAQLRAAAPAVDRVLGQLGPFVRVVAPALAQIGPVLTLGTRVARKVRPLLGDFARYARSSLTSAIASARLFTSLRDRGFSEAFFSGAYYLAAVLARYDAISHFAAATLSTTQCSVYATTPVPGCSAHVGEPAGGSGNEASGGPLQALARYLVK